MLRPATVAGIALVAALAALLLTGRLSQSSGRPVGPAADHCPRVAAGAPPARHGKLVVGLNSVWNNDCNLAAVAAAGVTMERLELDWSAVEPRPGAWTFDGYDKEFALAARHGITMLPLLMNVPGWAGHGWNVFPSRPDAYARFVARVVGRYGPHGSFWRAHPDVPARPARWFEIWNEPYLSDFSAGGVNPAAYARLFKRAAAAGRRADRSARFLLEADLTGLPASGPAIPWVAPMFAAVPDLARWFDGVAVHPYTGTSSPKSFDPGSSRTQFKRIVQIRQQFAAHGAGSKPFWITEVGWSTCPADPIACVSEPTQAHYLRQAFQLVKADYPWVKALFPYNYRDGVEAGGTDKEAWFGLIRRAGQPKPAWKVLRAQARG
jgi:polysaccharide biosynthesis protein PslG